MEIMTQELYNRIKENPYNYRSGLYNTDKLNWRDICCGYKLSKDFINEFKDYLDWYNISRKQKISFKFIMENIENITIMNDVSTEWMGLSENKNLNLTDGQWNKIKIKKWQVGHKDELKFIPQDLLNRIEKNPEKYIHYYDNSDKIDWYEIISYRRLSEEFVEKYIKYIISDNKHIDKFRFSVSQNLTEYLIDKYNHYLDWKAISRYQTLTEDMIDKYKYYLDWRWISQTQFFSFDFIMKNIDFIVIEINYELSPASHIGSYPTNIIQIGLQHNKKLNLTDEQCEIINSKIYFNTQYKSKRIINDNGYFPRIKYPSKTPLTD